MNSGTVKSFGSLCTGKLGFIAKPKSFVFVVFIGFYLQCLELQVGGHVKLEIYCL